MPDCARGIVFLRDRFSDQKASSKLLNNVFHVTLCHQSKKLPWFDPALAALTAYIRQKWPDMPILLMSRYLSPEMAEIISGWSGVEFVPKPIDAPEFLSAVDRLACKSN